MRSPTLCPLSVSVMRSILFFDTNTEIGGVVTVLTTMLKKLDRRLFKVSVACQRGGRPERAISRIPDQELVRCSFGTKPAEVRTPFRQWLHDVAMTPITIGTILRLSFFVVRNKVEVLHTSDKIRSVFICYSVSVLTGRPFVYHVHGPYVANMLNRLALDRAQAIVANSHAMKADYVRQIGHAMDRIQVVHNGTETMTNMDGPDMRRQLGIDREAVVVGISSRLAPRKGQEEFLRAAARVLEQAPATWFIVAGDDSIEDGNRGYQDRLKALAVSLGIAHRVKFLGFCDDMNPVYRTMDIAVDAAWEEAFGMVVIEPMVFGKPVIATNAGGIREIVDNGRNGLLVQPKNIEALSEAMLSLVLDGSLRRRLGDCARVAVAERFDAETHAELLSTVLESAGNDR
jgi:glycosyltransferase involved in cell wall biosynthesis